MHDRMDGPRPYASVDADAKEDGLLPPAAVREIERLRGALCRIANSHIGDNAPWYVVEAREALQK